ncbi:MAG: hypothetical protein PHO15_01685 [Eubacteriales bacterium]|nr:hypothetical protein [Eubacteriales bacterium]
MGITKPSKAIFWISLIIGLFAILNEFVINISIPIISEIANIVLLAIAFVLLVLGVIFKKL